MSGDAGRLAPVDHGFGTQRLCLYVVRRCFKSRTKMPSSSPHRRWLQWQASSPWSTMQSSLRAVKRQQLKCQVSLRSSIATEILLPVIEASNGNSLCLFLFRAQDALLCPRTSHYSRCPDTDRCRDLDVGLYRLRLRRDQSFFNGCGIAAAWPW